MIALALPVAAPAVAAAAPSAPKIQTQSQQSRLGGFRSARRPSFGSRYRSRRPYYRPRGYRRPSLFRGVLQALGIAYLFHALFGLGAGGGSPFGLLLILAFVAWLVTRGRRRRMTYRY
jgi:uncharacterized membrane protein